MSDTQSDRVKIKAIINWAFLNKKSDMSDKFQVELANLSDRAVEALESIGITPKRNPEKPEKGFYITCYSQNPIRAYDNDGVPVPTDVSVGNGSEAVAVVTPYAWEKKGKKGVSPTLRRLVVTKLIEYSPTNKWDDPAEEAF